MVGGIFCDLQKAFNCVQHKILLDKLSFYEIDGKFKTLIESYLTNGYQKVSLEKTDCNDNSSEWQKLIVVYPRVQFSVISFFLNLYNRSTNISK